MKWTQRDVATTNVYETTLAKGICFGRLDPETDAGWGESTVFFLLFKYQTLLTTLTMLTILTLFTKLNLLFKLGTKNSAENRDPK